MLVSHKMERCFGWNWSQTQYCLSCHVLTDCNRRWLRWLDWVLRSLTHCKEGHWWLSEWQTVACSQVSRLTVEDSLAESKSWSSCWVLWGSCWWWVRVECFLKYNMCWQDHCCNSKPIRSGKWMSIHHHWQCCHHHIVLGFSWDHHHTQLNSILDHQLDWCIWAERNHHKDMWKDTVYKYHLIRDHNCWQYHKLDKLWVIDMSNNLSMNMVDIFEKLSWGRIL